MKTKRAVVCTTSLFVNGVFSANPQCAVREYDINRAGGFVPEWRAGPQQTTDSIVAIS
jgi:hypothetical protein